MVDGGINFILYSNVTLGIGGWCTGYIFNVSDYGIPRRN